MSAIAWDLYPKDVFRWVSFGTTNTPSTETTKRPHWQAYGLSAFNDVFVWSGKGASGSTTTTDVIRNFSLREWRQWRRPEDDAELERRGLEAAAAEVIDDVAARQAGDYRQDDQQRLEELRGELRLKGLEMRSAHIEALNEHRAGLIREELQRIFQKRQDDENTAILLILAASA